MQLKCHLDDGTKEKIYAAVQSERINRYKAAADQENIEPLSMYAWNCDISEAFYISLHFAEVVCRNSIHQALLSRAGEDWPTDTTFRSILGERFLAELDSAIREERSQHGSNATCHHIVSALTFGFWEHLTTKRFERFLYPQGFREIFPNAKVGSKLHDVNKLIQSVRRWRNRVAHHRAIFDKGPIKKHDDALTLIRWRCHATQKWVSDASRVSQAIAARPKNPNAKLAERERPISAKRP